MTFTDIIRRFIPAPQQLSIVDVYPCLAGQAERNRERMDAIKAEMGAKYILHPSHTKSKLDEPRPV